MKQHAIFDTELIGDKKPVFFIGVLIKETGEKRGFWLHKKGHLDAFEQMLSHYTWVGFNSENFDRPLIAAALMGYDAEDLKKIANAIIEDGMRSWQTYKMFNLDFVEYDHIDLIETAPGVMISLKTYAGRMGYPTMQDMPFHHETDLKPSQLAIVESYCYNDIGVTNWLHDRLKTELELRVEMGKEYGLDLRSKSDAQVAEAILKKQINFYGGDKIVPRAVRYETPSFIKTKNPRIKALIQQFEEDEFIINRNNGSPIESDWMTEPFAINKGMYKVGLGGLHSQHDKQFYKEANNNLLISDFDVASYYPNIMMKAELVPKFSSNKGQLFLDEYRDIYERRIAAKRAGNKKVANTLKIVLNGTFGKLGSIYSAFYSPDLLIAVTITGQLNLLCLIDELENIKGVEVYSANTDGITVGYSPAARDKVLKVFATNAKRTGFEYEETPYSCIAMKDVNNYIAICTDGKVKTKGLYAESSLMKNPTMQVCSDAAVAYLKDGIDPALYMMHHKDPADYVSIRNVKGGGVQHKKIKLVDDWENVQKGEWFSPSTGKTSKRVSRPAPLEIGVGGEPFGRVARWYMTVENLPPITYVGSGNNVPKTAGARVCMELPKELPNDLNKEWYVDETYAILESIGCKL